MFTLRYDLLIAVQAGYPGHPKNIMEDLGYKDFNIRNEGKGTTLFIDVHELLEPMPPFLERNDVVDGRIEIDPKKRDVQPPIEFPAVTMHFHQDPLVWTFNFGQKGGRPE